MTWLAAALLVVAVAAAWIGAAGFARLRTPLDRLHATSFVNATTLLAIAAAAFATDGVSLRAVKLAMTAAASLVIGAAVAHVTARAILTRGGA